MVIKRYTKTYMNKKVKKYISGEVEHMENVIERPCSIIESMEKSFQEITEYKNGKRNLKTLEESKKLWGEWIEDDD